MSTRTSIALGLSAVVVVFVTACSGGSESNQQETAGGQNQAVQTSQVPEGMFVGQVTETMNAGGYTYVRLERGAESIWAAGPESVVQVGEEIGVSMQMPMPDFHSESLDRDFGTVYFVGAFERNDHAHDDAPADPHAGMPGMSGMSGTSGNANTAAPTKEIDLTGVVKPEGGHTVAEICDGAEKLAGKPVVFCGRVVKYNGGVMGLNWLHVQDGTGDPAEKNHDITVTTNQKAKVGDLVTIRGVVAVGKDLGSGYFYEVIVENASVEVAQES